MRIVALQETHTDYPKTLAWLEIYRFHKVRSRPLMCLEQQAIGRL